MAGNDEVICIGNIVQNGNVWKVWRQEKTNDFKQEIEQKVGSKLVRVSTSNGIIQDWYV